MADNIFMSYLSIIILRYCRKACIPSKDLLSLYDVCSICNLQIATLSCETSAKNIEDNVTFFKTNKQATPKFPDGI